MLVLAPSETSAVVLDGAALAAQLADVVVVDVRPSHEYSLGRIPGSVSLPLRPLLLENSTREQLTRLALVVQEAVARRGVSPDDRVVIVDRGDGFACVSQLLFEMAGCRNVAVLADGIRGWMNDDRTLAGGEVSAPTPSEAQWLPEPDFSTVAPLDDVIVAWRTGGARLVDVRSQLEHEGIVGSPCCERHGHVPGSLHLDWTAFLSPVGSLHSAERIRAEAAAIGLQQDDPIIVYCHSGSRSAVAALALRSAGFTSVRNWLGSWHEWSSLDLPVAPER